MALEQLIALHYVAVGRTGVAKDQSHLIRFGAALTREIERFWPFVFLIGLRHRRCFRIVAAGPSRM